MGRTTIEKEGMRSITGGFRSNYRGVKSMPYLSPRNKMSVIDQARSILKPFLNLSGPEWRADVKEDGEGGLPVDVIFSKEGQRDEDEVKVVLSNVWVDHGSGEILQYGSNYGMLVL